MSSPEAYLSGHFRNNLGSTIVVEAKNGIITGQYQTSVVDGDPNIDSHLVQGTYKGTSDGVLITFSVQWTFKRETKVTYSVTSWSGKAYYAKNSFTLSWLLINDLPEHDAWKGTWINQDTFTKLD
jgi:hypothetical protein